MSELTEYGDIINAVVSVPLFRRVRELGIKVVLDRRRLGRAVRRLPDVPPGRPGSGPAGCSCTRSATCAAPSCSGSTGPAWAHGVEARVPFLDLSVVELAMRLPVELKLRDGQEKWIVRRGVRRPAARLHPAAAEEPDVVLVGLARAGPAVQAAVRPAAPLVRLRPARAGPAGLRQRAEPVRQRPRPGHRRRADPTRLHGPGARPRPGRRGQVERRADGPPAGRPAPAPAADGRPARHA